MKKEDLRIVFMGTPHFAVESLKALVENNYNVVGVVTMPDKPAGRGYKLQSSAVKEYAVSQGLPVLQPEKLKNEDFLTELKRLNPHLQVVVAFRMLPEVVWNMPPLGTFNLHASLLPQYRGAAPINWALINGEEETGVTTFFLSHEIDTGKIIFREKTPISPNDNVETLHDRLMQMGARLVLKTVDAVLIDEIEAVPQSHFFDEEADLKPAPKIFKDTCRINWQQSATQVRNFIRGLSPFPAAWTELASEDSNAPTFKIFSAELSRHTAHPLPPSTIVTDNKTHLLVAVNDGFLEVTDIQLSGKKRMKTTDFLNGYKFSENARFV